MGDSVSLPRRKETQAGFSVVCDDCGQVFSVSHEITAGRESKKRCCRCSALLNEEKVGRQSNLRKCATCQCLFAVSQCIAEQPLTNEMNCFRCGDTHRDLLRSKAYVQVSLQKGAERVSVTCPRALQGELRRCMTQKQEQGYNMLSLTEDSFEP